MWSYDKRLQYPVNIKNPNPQLAKIVITQLGGPDGELGASMRYLNQRYAMPYKEGKAILTDIGTEELAHMEMISAIVYQLTRNLTREQILESGFAPYFVDHTTGIYPQAASGMPWSAATIQSTGDPIADLFEDLAAEQKARLTYDNLLRLIDDPDVRDPIKFLRAREIVHFQRFGDANLTKLSGCSCEKWVGSCQNSGFVVGSNPVFSVLIMILLLLSKLVHKNQTLCYTDKKIFNLRRNGKDTIISMDKTISLVKAFAEKYSASKLALFGSRARGDNRERSDYDFAIWGLEGRSRALFQDAVENELESLYPIDLVFIDDRTSPELLKNIYRDGVVLMDKFETKLVNFQDALGRLKEGVQAYRESPAQIVRDGVIQRFEFTCELAWKTTREYLLSQNFTDINSPKAAMRQAFASGLIDDDCGWIELLNARNMTSHIYNEESAQQIYEKIEKDFVQLFESLVQKLKKDV